jgi:hypothetical protein
METKTITLELDAYERLRVCRLPGESFSEVVRRAVFTNNPPSGSDLLAYFRAGGSGVSDAWLDAVEQAAGNDPPPDNPWS